MGAGRLPSGGPRRPFLDFRRNPIRQFKSIGRGLRTRAATFGLGLRKTRMAPTRIGPVNGRPPAGASHVNAPEEHEDNAFPPFAAETRPHAPFESRTVPARSTAGNFLGAFRLLPFGFYAGRHPRRRSFPNTNEFASAGCPTFRGRFGAVFPYAFSRSARFILRLVTSTRSDGSRGWILTLPR